MRPVRILWRPILGAALFAGGHILRPLASDPDAHFGAAKLIGTFLIFAFWALSVQAIGSGVSRAVTADRRLYLDLGLGTCFASFAAALAGHLGLIGYDLKWLFCLVLFGGLFLPPRGTPKTGREPLTDRFVELALAGSLVIAATTVLLRAGILHGHSDPALYHLLGPRAWTDA